MWQKRVVRDVGRSRDGGLDPAFWERLVFWASGVGEGTVALLSWMVVAVRTLVSALLRVDGRPRSR